MHRPVLVTPPTGLPVTLDEMKRALRIAELDGDGNVVAHEDDELITAQIASAVAHYEGWTGILGIVLCEQTWRQDFDDWGCHTINRGRVLALPLGPVQAGGIVSVKWRASDGTLGTVASADYSLFTDGGGRSYVRFASGYSFPGDLHESGAVTVEYKAGWPAAAGESTVPADIKTAIKIRVQMTYDEAAQANAEHLERIERQLISTYRRMGI